MTEISERDSQHPQALPVVSVLRSRIESLLLISDEPIHVEDLARVLSTEEEAISVDVVRAVLSEIADEFDARGSGFELRELHDAWRLYTRRSNSDIVESKLLDGTQQKLSRAALETLAVIAYRQPCTRAQVAAVRGVNCDGVIRTLTLRGLIAETGESAGAHLYSTTDLFLEQLGMESLADLPELAPLLPDVDDIDD
ncbi:Segregation and condensation protein B [Corynebacterium urogenitale]|uniref:Segregation and condensation protein B n=1 Tax=Corynebacterium urogenitale TaxID=2487892 RepID=A0A5J6ZAA1_9CORY|nr:SMC-Scp complex subunit ScpB [Corynebacterium urogenitale]QFQ02269.1 Segregation and condensation protein B [Corynebacterium urogenitale]